MFSRTFPYRNILFTLTLKIITVKIYTTIFHETFSKHNKKQSFFTENKVSLSYVCIYKNDGVVYFTRHTKLVEFNKLLNGNVTSSFRSELRLSLLIFTVLQLPCTAYSILK